uniref:Uncharacterized protein n=1 Tax=Panagrolaimus superbus TaxID=310955 RepID=A0A914YBG6_9BILA
MDLIRKGFIFPSFDALSDILCEASSKAAGKRIRFTDNNGHRAYADICDPKIITAISALAENKTSELIRGLANDYCQLNARGSLCDSTSDKTKPKFCLIRDSSGYITMKKYPSLASNSACDCCRRQSYSQHGQCYNEDKLIQKTDMIGQVFPTNSKFDLHLCKIEFV